MIFILFILLLYAFFFKDKNDQKILRKMYGFDTDFGPPEKPKNLGKNLGKNPPIPYRINASKNCIIISKIP